MISSNLFKFLDKISIQDSYKTLSALVILFCTVYFTFKNVFLTRHRKAQRQAELVNKFPGLGYYPLLGSMPEMFRLCLSPTQEILKWTGSMAKRYGPVFKVWALGRPIMVICSAETAIAVLPHENLQAKPIDAVNVAKICNGEGLIVLSPDFHRQRRKQWMQWLNRKTIDESFTNFRNESVSLCKKLDKFAENGEQFNIVDPVIHTTLRTAATSAFGKEFVRHLPDSESKQFTDDLHTFSLNMIEKLFRPWLSNDWIFFNLTSAGRETKKCINRGNALVKRALTERKIYREKSPENFEKVPCFLDHLLDLKEKGILTEHEIIQELNVFIVGGYDTTGLTISYTLYCLALNVEHQTKVVNELEEIFGQNLDQVENITPGNLREMKYLELCIKESLRLYSTGAFSHRRSTGDVVLPDGRIIPGDVDIYVDLCQIHRDSKYFPDPEKFEPERHLVPIKAYLPFAIGSRNCVGQVYAMQVIKMNLAHLLLKFRWETVEVGELKFICNTFLLPENGIHFKIQKRF